MFLKLIQKNHDIDNFPQGCFQKIDIKFNKVKKSTNFDKTF